MTNANEYTAADTISATLLLRATRTPHKIGYQTKVGDHWISTTYYEFYKECEKLSFGLFEAGVRHGTRVALWSSTRIEWTMCDMAIVSLGAITVPIYPTTAPDDLEYILHHAGVEYIFIESENQLSNLLEIFKHSPEFAKVFKKIITLADLETDADKYGVEVLSIREVIQNSLAKLNENPDFFSKKIKSAQPSDIISICYTSGTTGIPKGVQLTHLNLMSVLKDATEMLSPDLHPDEDRLLSFLPASHVLGKVESLVGLVVGWQQFFASNFKDVWADILSAKPTIIFGVPKFFESTYSRILEEVAKSPVQTREIFGWTQKNCIEIVKSESQGIFDQIKLGLAQKLVFKRVREGLGGALRFMISGGGPLNPEIAAFFKMAGIPVLEGYGLTETCAPVTLNTPEHFKLGSVGLPLPNVDLKISDDGEILIRSDQVFPGYYHEPDATADAIKDEWLYSGDIGHVDSDGYLFITDRKRDLIINTGGKNISPQKIEKLVSNHPWVKEFVVIGDGRDFPVALIELNHEKTVEMANKNHILFSTYEKLVANKNLLALVRSEIIEPLNEKLAAFEKIGAFYIVSKPFTIEDHEVTPSQKIRRKQIEQHYRTEIESLYRNTNIT